MTKNRQLIIPAVILGIVLIVIGRKRKPLIGYARD